MSGSRRLRDIGCAFSAALRGCKAAAARCRRRAAGIMRAATSCRHSDLLEDVRMADAGHPLRIDFAGRRVELQELINVLSIGDRLRVLCDDGVLVAEKISETRFKLIHSETMSKLVH